MSGVRGIGGVAAPAAGGRPARPQGGFSVPDGATRAEAAGAAAAVPAAALLALQSVADEPVADREARRRGFDLLAELSALQRELLDAPPTQARLGRIGELLQAIPAAGDQRLAAVVAEVALRARIELARYGAA